MTIELDDLDAELASIVSPLETLRSQLVNEREGLREKVSYIDQRLSRLNRVLNAVSAQPNKPGPKPRQAKTTSSELAGVVIDALKQSEKPLSVQDLVDRTGKSASAMHSTVAALRSQEVIRQAGVEPSPIRPNTKRKIYALMPNAGGVNGSQAS